MKTVRKAIRVSTIMLVVLVSSLACLGNHWIPLPEGPFADWPLGFGGTGPIAAKDGILYAVYPLPGWVRPVIRRYYICSDTWDSMASANDATGNGGRIDCMTIRSGFLYVGGFFERIGPAGSQIEATNVAKCDLSSGTWYPVGDGSLTNKVVLAIAVPDNGHVYVGLFLGDASEYATGVDTEVVKKWDGNQWSTVGQGMLALNWPNQPYGGVQIQALTTDGTKVYVAGQFFGARDSGGSVVPSRNLVEWNPSSGTWRRLSDGCGVSEEEPECWDYSVPPTIMALAVADMGEDGKVLVAVGDFWNNPSEDCPCEPSPARGMITLLLDGDATLNQNAFPSINCQQGLSAGTARGFCLASDGANVYMGGVFDSVTCNNTAYSVAVCPGALNSWLPIGNAQAMTTPPNLAYFNNIAIDQYSIYVGGDVTDVEGVPCNTGLARFPLAPFTSGGCMGKLAWWRMEQNGIDSAMGHNGSIVNSASAFTFTTGKFGLGAKMSAKSAGLFVEDAPALNFGNGTDFTVEAWVRADNATTSFQVMSIIGKRVAPSSGTVTGYELALSQGKIIFQMANTSGQVYNSPTAGSDLRGDNQWHHLAATVQRTGTPTGKLYVDGQEVGSFTPLAGDLTSTAPLRIGMHPTPTLDCNFRGRIDEPGVFSRALSATEIQGIYNSGKQSLPANAVAWWPLEGDGTDVVGSYDATVEPMFEFLPHPTTEYYSQLNGKAGGLTVPNSADLNFGTSGEFTIHAWIKPEFAYTSFSVMDIVDKRVTSGTVTGYELALSSGKLVFQMANTSGQIQTVGGTGANLIDDQWHHVAVTVQRVSSGGKLYVDGSLVTTFTPQSGDITSTAPLLIGLHPDVSIDGNLRGGIDEVTMYNRALTATEIQAAHSSGNP